MKKKLKDYSATYLLEERSYVHPVSFKATDDREAVVKAIQILETLEAPAYLDVIYDEDETEIWSEGDYTPEETEAAWYKFLIRIIGPHKRIV